MKKILSILILNTAILILNAQNFTISGSISDASTGETISGAIISIPEIPNLGTASNAYGFYSLSAPNGSYTLKIKFLGYQEKMETINIQG